LREAGEEQVMEAKEKLLFLWLFVVIVISFVITHFSHYLLFALENSLASVLAGPIGWS
jgi:hypothetical protein